MAHLSCSTFALTENHLREYDELGFTLVRGVISRQRAEHLRREALRLVAHPSVAARVHRERGDTGRFLVDFNLHQRSDLFHRLAFEPRVLQIASHFLREPEFYFFYDQLFFKDAHTTTRTQWHQDLPYWPLRGERIPSIWIALTAVDEDSSAVQYLPRSHRNGKVFVAVNPEESAAARAAGLDVCPDIHHSDARNLLKSYSLRPGDAVVHHPLVVHGAGTNRCSYARIAVSLRYCASDTAWDPRENTMFFPGTQAIPQGTRLQDQGVFRACTWLAE